MFFMIHNIDFIESVFEIKSLDLFSRNVLVLFQFIRNLLSLYNKKITDYNRESLICFMELGKMFDYITKEVNGRNNVKFSARNSYQKKR